MKSLTVGMMTFYRHSYGAFLEAYALQTALKRLGYDAEMIRYDEMKNPPQYSPVQSHPRLYFRRILSALMQSREMARREAVFTQSVKRHIAESAVKFANAAQLHETPPRYDIYLVGSDQAFNPKINPQGFEARLLDFTTDMDVKRASYAAGIDTSDLSLKNKASFHRLLSRFNAVSVRERRCCEIVRRLTGHPAQCHVTPTLLLGREDWQRFAKRPTFLPDRYILFCMMEHTEEMVVYAKALSERTGLPVLPLDGRGAFDNSIDTADTVFSPEEFVGAMEGASFVVTNSFHALCFMVTFELPGRVFLPETESGRISELIERYCLEALYCEDPVQIEKNGMFYRWAQNVREREQRAAFDYLGRLKD